MKTNKGFSLVELIVVIAIMAIIAAVAVPVYNTYITKADDSVGLDKIDGIVYAVKLANIEFFTETTAEFDGDDTTNKTVTVSFFGTNKNLAALRVGEILNVTAENDNVTFTLNKSLTDTAHEKAVAKLAEINTYEADVPDNNGDVNDNNDGGMVDNVPQDPPFVQVTDFYSIMSIIGETLTEFEGEYATVNKEFDMFVIVFDQTSDGEEAAAYASMKIYGSNKAVSDTLTITTVENLPIDGIFAVGSDGSIILE